MRALRAGLDLTDLMSAMAARLAASLAMLVQVTVSQGCELTRAAQRASDGCQIFETRQAPFAQLL